MKIVVQMTYDADIIEVPNHIGNNIEKYQAEFDKWLYNKKIITRFGLIKKERNVGYVLEVMLLFIG